MRALILTIATGLVVMLVVLLVIDPGGVVEPARERTIWIWVVGSLLSLAAWWLLRMSRTHALAKATTPGQALALYRVRLFIQVSLAEVPALLAFVIAFTAMNLSPYIVSLPASLVLLAYSSPRPGDLRFVQLTIDDAGGSVRIADVLMGHA